MNEMMSADFIFAKKMEIIAHQDLTPYVNTPVYQILLRRKLCALKYKDYCYNEDIQKQVVDLVEYLESLIKQLLSL